MRDQALVVEVGDHAREHAVGLAVAGARDLDDRDHGRAADELDAELRLLVGDLRVLGLHLLEHAGAAGRGRLAAARRIDLGVERVAQRVRVELRRRPQRPAVLEDLRALGGGRRACGAALPALPALPALDGVTATTALPAAAGSASFFLPLQPTARTASAIAHVLLMRSRNTAHAGASRRCAITGA